ncbi:MAG: T9SS type A sorting domain-containing protein [bacterium]|nr:T9SS type A sorting domain-containing protein [bacterium]
MFLKVYKFKLLLAFLLVPFLVSADPPGWEKTETQFTNVMKIPSTVVPRIEGVAIEDGDWVGVFFNDDGTLVCGGSAEYTTDITIGFSSYGDDTLTSEKDGFADGESFTWAIYDASAEATIYGETSYAVKGVGVFTLPHSTHTLTSLTCPAGFIQLAPTINILEDSYTICENQFINFAGEVETNGQYSRIRWTTTNGLYDFYPDDVLDPVYYPTLQDITAFKQTGECIHVFVQAAPISPCAIWAEDNADICFQLLPTVVVGEDATICANETYTTNPTVENSVGPYMWTHDGNGSFDDPALLNATYLPDVTDTDKTIVLTLAVELIGPCVDTVSGSMKLYIECAPFVNAGRDQTICETDSAVLKCTASCVDSVKWASTGNGHFNPPDCIQGGTTYIPGSVDIAAGCVTLVLIGCPLDPCTMYEVDKMKLCFSPAPLVDAGDDQTICAGDSVNVTGIAEDVDDHIWVMYNGSGTFDDDTALSAFYTPGPTDGFQPVGLILVGAPISPCTTFASDTLWLTVQNLPAVDAGARSALICEDGSLALNGASEQYTSTVSWTGDGTFDPNADTLNPTFTPSTEAIAAGSAELCLTGAPIDPCTVSVEDYIIVKIQLNSTVNIIPTDITICEGDVFDFSNRVEYGGGQYAALIWSTNGYGDFSPNGIGEFPIYKPNATKDWPLGCVKLCVKVYREHPCVLFVSDTMNLCFQKPVEVYAGDTATICEDDTYTMAPVIENGGAVLWTTLGDGYFDDPTDPFTDYHHGDNDRVTGDVKLCVEVQGLSTCPAVNDCMILYIQWKPEAYAGEDMTICEQLYQGRAWTNGQAKLTDATVGNTCSQMWSAPFGDGIFNDPTEVNTFYTLGDRDIARGSVALCLTAEPCDPCTVAEVDRLIVTVQYSPEAEAGPNVTVCEGDGAQLYGSTMYASGVFWDFALLGEGDGTFSNQIMDHPIYYPGHDDIIREYVELIFVAFPLDPCTYPVADSMMVYITRQPFADAGADATICAGEDHQLNGSGDFATGGFEWRSGGDGTFAPDADTLDAVYTPGPLDITGGGVDLCLWAYDASACSVAYFDCMHLTIYPPPEIDAGADGTVCEDLTYQLAGWENNTRSVTWTTAGDGTFDNILLLNAIYTPGSDDVAAGSVVLTLTGYPLSRCSATVDYMTLTIQLLPIVDAGDNTTTCEDLPFTTSPTITTTNTYSVLWTHKGNGSFDDPTLDVVTYTPGAGDTNNVVILTLTVTPGDFCTTPVSDFMELYIQSLPIVDAGVDGTICEDATFTTSPTITRANAYTVMWTHTGFGSFDDPTLDNATYSPAAGDEGTDVTLTLTVTPADFCTTPVPDEIGLTIQALPTVDAGVDQTICEDVIAQLDGTAANYSAVLWTGGVGAFNATDILDPTYTPDASEYGTTLTLCIEAMPISPCKVSANDCMDLFIQLLPTIDAGVDQTICQGEGGYALLDATAANYSAVLWTGGVGAFNATDILDPTYKADASEYGTTVTLCIEAMPISACTISANDCMELFVQEGPSADAGGDLTICDNEDFAVLDGTCLNGASVKWSTPNGTGYFDQGSSCDGTYWPSSDDIAAGSVTLCLRVDAILPCVGYNEDCITLTFPPSPTANAGNDITVCEGDLVAVDGIATDYDYTRWTTSGNGTFDDPLALATIYTPSIDDVANGGATLTFTAYPTGGCLMITANDDLKLRIVVKPYAIVDLGVDRELSCDDYDVNNTEWRPIKLFPVINIFDFSFFLTTVKWSSTGTGYFDDPTRIQAIYHMSSADVLVGNFELCLEVGGLGPCSFVAADCFAIAVPKQIIHFNRNGWCGISSYLNPDLPTVPEVMDPIVKDPVDGTGSRHLVSQINIAGQSFWPEPIPMINQLGDWAPIGYKAKIKDAPACLPIFGDMLTDQTFEINGSFTYVPVPTNVAVPIADLFKGHIYPFDTLVPLDVLYIYDWSTQHLWTQGTFQTSDLQNLLPGRAYLLVSSEASLTYTIEFPDFKRDVTFVTAAADGGKAGNNSLWNDVENTALPHVLMFADEVLAEMKPGDIIGAFNQNDDCVGMEEFVDRQSFFKLIAMGADPSTLAVDGFESGEIMNFKLYCQATAETFEVSFTYDTQFPSYDGLFAINGFSRVVGMTMSITRINDIPSNYSMNVYPNPAKDVINVASDYNMKSITLVNDVGQTVYTQPVTGKTYQISVSNYVTGMYFVRIETTDGSVITKRVAID